MCISGSTMMSPAAGGAVLGLQTAGAVYSSVGAYYASKEKQAALNAQAGIDEINARVLERTAQQELRAGQLNEQKSRLQTAAFKSSQRASLAASGVDLGSDSAIALLTSTDVMGEIDANQIATGALRSAWGYRMQATNSTNSALLNRAQARGISPLMSGASTLLTGATDVASSYYSMRKAGVFG